MRDKGHQVISALAISVFLTAFLCAIAHAASFSSRDLIENAKLLDGKVLTYKGEAITAIMDRGEYSWINVFDGYNAIGVWCTTSSLKDVRFLGDYKHKGDMLEVEGVFNRACPAHKGELDIHALKVNSVEQGYRVEEHIDTRKIYLAVIIFLLTLLVIYVFRKKI
jgi:hypothetical protein